MRLTKAAVITTATMVVLGLSITPASAASTTDHPGPVGHLTAAVSPSTITLRWTAPGKPFDTVAIGMNFSDTPPTAPDTGDEVVDITDPSTTSYVFDGLDSIFFASSFSFAVYVRDGTSPWSHGATLAGVHLGTRSPTVTVTRRATTALTLHVSTDCPGTLCFTPDTWTARYARGDQAPTSDTAGLPVPAPAESEPDSVAMHDLQPGAEYSFAFFSISPGGVESAPTVVHLATRAAGPGGAISGVVTAVGGAPLSKVDVYAYDKDGYYVTHARSAEDGSYTLLLRAAGAYAVCFYGAPSLLGASGWAPACKGGGADPKTAQYFRVGPGSVSGVDRILQPGALGPDTVVGRATAKDGTPLAGVTIDASDPSDPSQFPTHYTTVTGDDGTYTLSTSGAVAGHRLQVCAYDSSSDPHSFVAGRYEGQCRSSVATPAALLFRLSPAP